MLEFVSADRRADSAPRAEDPEALAAVRFQKLQFVVAVLLFLDVGFREDDVVFDVVFLVDVRDVLEVRVGVDGAAAFQFQFYFVGDFAGVNAGGFGFGAFRGFGGETQAGLKSPRGCFFFNG